METEKFYMRVGIFCLSVIFLFTYYLMFVNAGKERQNLVRYGIYFDNSVSGLARGDPVKFKGFDVGIVADIRFVTNDTDRILVIVEIASTAPVREDTVASVDFQGITGTTYLSLENETPDKAIALLKKKDGQPYPMIRSEPSDFQAIMASAPKMMGELAQAANQMQKLLSDKNVVAVQGVISEAHDVMAEASAALRELKMLARTLREDPSIILRGTSYEGYKAGQ